MRLRLLVVLAVMALLAGACGNDTTEETTTTAAAGGETTTTAAAAETTTTAGGGDMEVTIRWRTRPDNKEEADVYQSISDELSNTGALAGVTLQYEPGGSEDVSYQQQLLTELSAGTAPDVFWVPGTDTGDFVKKNVVLDLRQYADATGFQDSDFYPGPMQYLTYDPATEQTGGPLWGVPRDVSTFALYINTDLIAEGGCDDPRDLAAAGNWTWDTFQQVAQCVADLGGGIKGYGQSVWWGPYGAWIYSAGGSFFNADRTACALDSDQAVEGLSFLADLYATDAVVTYGEDPEAPFRAGTLGMFQNGRWATPGIRTVDFNWDVVKLPEGPGGAVDWLFWGAYMVNANTEHPEEAWALVNALTQADIQAQISELGANVPSRVSQAALDAFLTFTPPANNQAFLDGLAEDPAVEGPVWKGSWPDFVAGMDTATTAVVKGEETPDAFKTSVCTELDRFFE